MTPEERQLLKETAEIVKENNTILRGMRRHARFSTIIRIIYWIIIIGGIVFSYYAIQPFIAPEIKGYGDIQDGLGTIKNTTAKIPWLSNQ